MIRTLLATTAIATLIATGAVAQTTTTPPADPSATGAAQEPMTIHAEGHLASNLIGEAVYNGTGEEAENIGDVTDLVINPDGNVEAIVVGVGGFLGIGQKEVALEYDLAEWSEQPDGERWLVVETTEDALRAQEEFDRSAYEPMPSDAEVSETEPATQEDLANAPTDQEGESADGAGGMTGGTMATAPATDQTEDTAEAPADDAGETSTATAPADDQAGGAAGGAVATVPDSADSTDNNQQAAQTDQAGTGEEAATDQMQTGAIDRSTLQEATGDQLSADKLTGTTVYGANEENIGEINDVVLTPEGQVDAVVIDVGGFLGVGEKQVAVGMDNLAFMTDEDDELYLFTEFTKEQLEAQPAYDESSYAENRDQMRLQAQ